MPVNWKKQYEAECAAKLHLEAKLGRAKTLLKYVTLLPRLGVFGNEIQVLEDIASFLEES